MHTPRRTRSYMLLVITLVLASVHGAAAADEPLPSWTDGIAKRAIVDFVQRVTTPGGKDFVPGRNASPRLITMARCRLSSRSIFSSPLPSTASRRWRPNIRSGRHRSRSSPSSPVT